MKKIKLVDEENKNKLPCSPDLADWYIEWRILDTIGSSESMNAAKVAGSFPADYNIKYQQIGKYLKENTQKVHAGYRLTDEQKAILDKVDDFGIYLDDESNNPESEIKESIKKVLVNGEKYPDILTGSIALLDQINSGRKVIDYEVLFFKHLVDKKENDGRLECALSNIKEENKDIKLNSFVSNKALLSAFEMSGIYAVGDLASKDTFLLSDCFFLDEKNIYETLEGLTKNINDALSDSVDDFYTILHDKGSSREFCFNTGYGIGKKLHGHTLESMGQVEHLTRERCRQLIVGAAELLSEVACPIITFGFLVIQNGFSNDGYLSYEKASEIIKNDRNLDILAIAASISKDHRLSYDLDLGVFYLPSMTSIDSIKSKILDNVNEIITKKEFDTKETFEQKIILEEYSLRKCGFYVINFKPSSYVVLSVLDRFFPSGYHLTGDDYNHMVALLKESYGDDFKIPTKHALEAEIQHGDKYCQIGKGTYLTRSAIEAPNVDFLLEITDFINSHGPSVFYMSIFENFKDQFLSLNATNSFYAKGLIDPYLRKLGFHTKRDYVQVKGSVTTSTEVVRATISQEKGVFPLQSLRDKFPGVKDYTFFFEMARESKVLPLGNNLFVNLPYAGVTEKGNEMIWKAVDEGLSESNGIVTCHKVYAKLQSSFPETKKELGSINSSYALFSYIKATSPQKGQYETRRPFIFTKGYKGDKESILVNHFSKMDEFTKRDCDNYLVKIGAKQGNFSFFGFVDSISFNFVLVDRYWAVNRENFHITDKELSSIKETMRKLTTVAAVFDSSINSSLDAFPTEVASFKMNKYLLLGVISTFCSDDFTVSSKQVGTSINYVITSNVI